MTAARTPSQIGRANRRRGATVERSVARYLAAWWPDAVRAVRSTTPDPGDIANTSPSLWWSVKDCDVERYPAWFAEMAEKAQGRIGLLVVRRRGHADPARWWCWTTLHDHNELVGAPPPGAMAGVLDEWPVRMELGHVAPLLHAAGYGDPAAPRDMTTPTLANPGRTAR